MLVLCEWVSFAMVDIIAIIPLLLHGKVMI